MSEYQILAVISAFTFLYSLVAARLERTPFNGALIYVLAGLLCGGSGLQLLDLAIDGEGLKLLAELTLAIVLFSDSANANLPVLRRIEKLPIRLLLIGLPMTIALGFGAGFMLYDSLTLFEIALLATMLAPTDAALGKAVVTNEAVPAAVREGLNVESGLNDGICVPVLLIFLALASGSVDPEETRTMVVMLPLQAIGVGAVVGVLLASTGSQLLKSCAGRGWISDTWQQVPLLALALLCFATAQRFGGSGFIAAFVGGLTFGALARQHEAKERLLKAAEGAGDTMSLITWFVFGAVVVGPHLQNPDLTGLCYAALSLTIVRMLPVSLCVFGLKLQADTRLFLGWFGPRGLASIVFIVMVLDQKLPGGEQMAAAVTWTILLSVIAHGLTANPLANWYAGRIKARDGQL